MSLTEKQIEEGSKLIANFMDYIYVGKRIITHNRRGHNQTPSITGYIHKSHLKEALDFKFYKSMNISGVGRLGHNYNLSNTVELGLKNGWYFSAICNHGTGLNYLPLNLKYHKDWNWLMPVVERIENLKFVDEFNIQYDSVAKGHIVSITPAYNNTFNAIYTEVYENKIDAVYHAVIKFIEWYNENK